MMLKICKKSIIRRIRKTHIFWSFNVCSIYVYILFTRHCVEKRFFSYLYHILCYLGHISCDTTRSGCNLSALFSLAHISCDTTRFGCNLSALFSLPHRTNLQFTIFIFRITHFSVNLQMLCNSRAAVKYATIQRLLNFCTPHYFRNNPDTSPLKNLNAVPLVNTTDYSKLFHECFLIPFFLNIEKNHIEGK